MVADPRPDDRIHWRPVRGVGQFDKEGNQRETLVSLYKHQKTEFGTNPRFVQHSVSDGQGRPFLRTTPYYLGREDEIATGKWLDEAVKALNPPLEKSHSD